MGTSCRKASVEKPWMQFYPAEYRVPLIEDMTLGQFLQYHNTNHDKAVVEYYDEQYSLNDLMEQADQLAKSLAAMGVKEGDQIASFLRSTPAFLITLLAVEEIGASLVCRDNTLEENMEAVRNGECPVMFAHDYLTAAEEASYYSIDTLKHIVLVSPYTYAKKEAIPDYILNSIDKLYTEKSNCDSRSIRWEDFIAQGESYTGVYQTTPDPHRPLYQPYTSGSTGPSKGIIHTAASLVGVLFQLMIPTPMKVEWRCLLTLLPPALIAIVVPIILYRISTTDLIILDPFCEETDIDLEFMRYRPNQMIAVPMMADIIRLSKRIPEDYDMSFLLVIGGGADPMHNKWLNKMQDFLQKHHSPAVFSMCYGMSEVGSVVCNPHANSSFQNCGSGIPMQHTTIAIFAQDSQEELDYNQVGEVCVHGPSLMKGYNNRPEETAKTLQTHPDGLQWVHTGDYGYMNEKGELFTLSRGINTRFNGGPLFITQMENKVVEVPGVDDCFFVIVRDREHPGYFLPYLYLVLDAGVAVSDIEEQIYAALEPHERPVRILTVEKREYFHFKVSRRMFAAKLQAEEEQEVSQ